MLVNSVVFDVVNDINEDIEIKDIYIKDIIFSGLTTHKIGKLSGLGAKYSIVSSDNIIYSLGFIYSTDAKDVDIINTFSKSIIDGQLHLGDNNAYTNASSFIIDPEDEDYPVYTYARDNEKYVRFRFAEKQSLLVKYIETKIIFNECPLGGHNYAILDCPPNFINTDILYVENNVTIKEKHYKYNKRNKIGHYTLIFNITNVKEDFAITISVNQKRKDTSIVNKYESIQDMINQIYNGKFDNFYCLSLDNTINMAYTKQLNSNPVEKKIFIYAEMDKEITRTFTFYRYGYENLYRDLMKLIGLE